MERSRVLDATLQRLTLTGYSKARITRPSGRLTGGANRGYAKVDFVDYLDALKCESLTDASTIDAVTKPVGYPYDNQELCQ